MKKMSEVKHVLQAGIETSQSLKSHTSISGMRFHVAGDGQKFLNTKDFVDISRQIRLRGLKSFTITPNY